jgi:hypothetical protein
MRLIAFHAKRACRARLRRASQRQTYTRPDSFLATTLGSLSESASPHRPGGLTCVSLRSNRCVANTRCPVSAAVGAVQTATLRGDGE